MVQRDRAAVRDGVGILVVLDIPGTIQFKKNELKEP